MLPPERAGMAGRAVAGALVLPLVWADRPAWRTVCGAGTAKALPARHGRYARR
ncbi:hypothetical protein AB0M41_23935 [Streptomyces sp. NPDC051896]|uniref:hypothetical protein n=1 Tax=Streptomyces sp. NPDC051896 TaxID=3155416 RepID=UPI003442D995